jgi:Asp-tRNA(Asn)/Glu-tRNA(Gln) amidotransferase A subunit family amidase
MLVERYLHDEHLNVTYGVLQNLRLRLRCDIDEAFGRYDALLTPTTPCTAPLLLANDELVSSGVLSHILKLLPYNTAPLNLSGHPAIAVPSGEDASGLPTSLQVAARRFEEGVALRIAQTVEAAVASAPSIDSHEDSELATD